MDRLGTDAGTPSMPNAPKDGPAMMGNSFEKREAHELLPSEEEGGK